MKFHLEIDVAEHAHSRPSIQQIIAHALDLAKQQVGDGRSVMGDLTYGAGFQQRKIGSWRLYRDEPTLTVVEGDEAA